MTFRQKMRALRCLIHIWMEQQNIEDEMFYAFYPPDDLPDMYHRAQSQTYWERLEWALEKLEGFASHFGAEFYGIPRNTGTVTMEKMEWEVPAHYDFARELVQPFGAGQKNSWRIVEPATQK